MRKGRYFFLLLVYMLLGASDYAQPGTTIDLKKPEKYESRTLASEKTPDSKIKKFRKFYQNTITHYNYFFNANLRLNEIVERAKLNFKDDYTRLLPYYNYTLDATSADTDLDSVIYKCNAGILLHDLRNDWIDDLYFLMGKAYYLRKNFDTAEHIFLYVNYAFAPKQDNYDVPVGSNVTGTTEFSIATKEKNKILSTRPRRNEDLIWVAKNYIDAGKPYEASAILEMLRYDPNFPDRLQSELHETIGYLYYTSGFYDSAAFHLSKATDLDVSKQDKARREYLTAQLYMMSGSKEEAQKYFIRSAEHTVDPYMAVFASLNAVDASADSADVSKKIEGLMQLAKKDRYVAYRDLIYYTAAQVLIQSGDYAQAYEYAQKSIKYNVNNPEQRSNSFMLLGDLYYLKPDYLLAKNAYDSVNTGTLPNEEDQQRLTLRLDALRVIAVNVKTVHIEDSLQYVAALPETERTALIRKTVRQLRKAKGLQEDEGTEFVNPAVQAQANNNPADNDLFAAQQAAAASKGEWYFNNSSTKSTGFTTFRSVWGNRPDVDNWRRIDAVTKQIAAIQQGNPDAESDSNQVDHPLDQGSGVTAETSPVEEVMNGEISYDALLAFLPLTKEKVEESNKKIADALFTNGQQFQNSLLDYNAAIMAYDSLLKRFPETDHLEETLFNLYYCYNKLGRRNSADSALAVLNTKFKDGKFAAMLQHHPKTNAPQTEDAATKAYEKVYNLFIEGKFDEAKVAKAEADSQLGSSYWTPQLLFIESIYYVSKHEDSSAIETLSALSDQFANSPLADKAQTMIDVLQRRSEIEDYLTNLQITRLSEDEPSPIINLNPVENIIDKKEIKRDSIVNKPVDKIAKPGVDTAKGISASVRTYVFNATDQQFVGIILNKVDPVYINETRNAFNRYNQVNFYSQKINSSTSKLNDSLNLVLLGPFSDAATAVIYLDKVKPKTAGMIIPWLKPEKYSFTIISQPNLDILNNTKDVSGYKEMIEKVLPGKF